MLDMNFKRDAISGQEGFYWLEKIKKIDPDVVVLFMTAYSDTDKPCGRLRQELPTYPETLGKGEITRYTLFGIGTSGE